MFYCRSFEMHLVEEKKIWKEAEIKLGRAQWQRIEVRDLKLMWIVLQKRNLGK